MKIAIIGAGLMGKAIAWDMVRSEGVENVLLMDSIPERLSDACDFAGDVETKIVDAGDGKALASALEGYDAAVSCVPYRYNELITKVCIDVGVHVCDLGGNNDVVDAQFRLSDLAASRGVTIIPDCGLAPGMASTWAYAAVEALDSCESVLMRCGGLPVDPLPPLNYMKLFSMTGLINEYVEPCRIVIDGGVAMVDGMSGLEKISFPEPFEEMEAFYTSGGTSTLVQTLHGRVDELDYKTIRYPGHCEQVRLLMYLGLTESDPIIVDGQAVNPRRTLEALLDRSLPSAGADVTLLRVDASGELGGRKTTIRFQLIDYADSANGISSMMRCTGFPAGAVARMMADGTINQRGVLPQELVVPAERLMADLAARGVEIERSEISG
ncbi:MAG TPA: saccharopine dehydrogenase C-terminal domain-containing protein [Acidobacteriota bacterium]|nr:saccharopine dehydrogenase C-terminal domain-containing protein [Acidobacteriota bacterium]